MVLQRSLNHHRLFYDRRMITLRSACRDLGISYHTLEKWMKRLEITPATHSRDFRFRVLQDEQLAEIRSARAEMPRMEMGVRVRAQEGDGARPRPRRSPRRVAASSDSTLSDDLVQSPLPDGLVSLESFTRLHHVAKPTAMKGVTSGRLRIVSGGEWMKRGGRIRYALDAAGRRQFYALWAGLSGFHACADCPHGEDMLG
jgi:hypothetical protein